LRSKIIP